MNVRLDGMSIESQTPFNQIGPWLRGSSLHTPCNFPLFIANLLQVIFGDKWQVTSMVCFCTRPASRSDFEFIANNLDLMGHYGHE